MHRKTWVTTRGWRTVQLASIFVAVAAFAAGARGDESADALAAEMKSDVVLRALVDELDREVAELHLPDLAKPYFIEYAVQDARYIYAGAEFGALTESGSSARRPLRADVRVGSYKQDNTNFREGWSFGGGVLPVEDDYTAIRQSLWWATDRKYKQVAENYARKLALMESLIIEDKPDDFSKEEPVVAFEERKTREVPLAEVEKLAVAASAVFREYPDVQEATVHIQGGWGNSYLVNSEGTRIRQNGSSFELEASASVQADDGMKLADSLAIAVEEFTDLPGQAELEQRCRDLAERLIRIKGAPRITETYTGPVLVEAEPAAGLFGGQFARRFAGGQRPVGSRTDPDDFEKKIGKRILPRSVTVIDDPTRKEINGTVAMGHYAYDDEGVPASAVTLVEGGRLKHLVMSRNPSRTFKQSTGHGNGFYQPSASTACLMVSSDDPADAVGLRAELLEAAQDEDLEYALRIASLGEGGPLEVYRVYADGREELVRGVENVPMNLRAFKRILAVGDTAYVQNVTGRQSSQTVACPALLFEELDVAPVDRDFDKPPLLPSPLAQADAKAGDAQDR